MAGHRREAWAAAALGRRGQGCRLRVRPGLTTAVVPPRRSGHWSRVSQDLCGRCSGSGRGLPGCFRSWGGWGLAGHPSRGLGSGSAVATWPGLQAEGEAGPYERRRFPRRSGHRLRVSQDPCGRCSGSGRGHRGCASARGVDGGWRATRREVSAAAAPGRRCQGCEGEAGPYARRRSPLHRS